MSDKSLRLPALLFLIILLSDQLTKQLALAWLQPAVPVPVLGEMLRWTLVFNPGGAFSVRLGSSTVYLITSIIIFLVLLLYIYRQRHVRFVVIPLSIVAGGALGNIIDRIRFGEVVDFIDVDIPDIVIGSYNLDRWPIFNIADSALSCGIITTIILIYYHAHKAKRQTRQENPSAPIHTDSL